MPADDVSVNGGAIDLLRFVDFTQLPAPTALEVVSSDPGDVTQSFTVEARDASGRVGAQTVALAGTAPVVFTTLGIVERVQMGELDAACAGTVTLLGVGGGPELRRLPPGKRGFTMLFRNTPADPAAERDYYSKMFWRNENGSLALLTAVISQAADPSARITHVLANEVNDVVVTPNRLTAPSGAETLDPDAFDDLDKVVPGTDLSAGDAIGVWFRMRLPARDASHRSSYTSQLAGQSI
jgi:hypothetical protein